jgi:hypothetical protein
MTNYTVGQQFWSRYKLLERPAQIKKGNITFKVPINGIQTNQLGNSYSLKEILK